LPGHADQHPAADGGEKTRAGSARRLARTIGRDAEWAAMRDWIRLAEYFAEAQLSAVRRACDSAWSRALLDDDAPIVGAGVGRFLAERLAHRAGRRYHEFSSLFDGPRASPDAVSDCAPAVAVAYLALQHVDR
jgi:uncharacterized hydantoinase/oxoprolinase family protein